MSLVFDAAVTLGIGKPTRSALPAPTDDYVTVRVPKGTTLRDVRTSRLGLEYMKLQDWFVHRTWYETPLADGLWLFRIMADSGGKSTSEQRSLMRAGESFAPPALAAAALLCLKSKGIDAINNNFLTVDSPPYVGPGYVLQLGWPLRLELLTHVDRSESFSVAAAARRLR